MAKEEYLIITNKYAIGSKYGPLLTDEYNYLCPECGGYGMVFNTKCEYCNGIGSISLEDERVVEIDESCDSVHDSLMDDDTTIFDDFCDKVINDCDDTVVETNSGQL